MRLAMKSESLHQECGNNILCTFWGITSYKSLAKALNVRGIPTSNNRQRYGATVKNVVDAEFGT